LLLCSKSRSLCRLLFAGTAPGTDAFFVGRDLWNVMPMRKIPQTIYLSADEIEQLARDREAEADALPDGDERQANPRRDCTAPHVRGRKALD
jgi:hypothetical protein